MRTNRGEPAMGAQSRAATLYSVGSTSDPDHEAAIRFDGEAPRQRAHSNDGATTMFRLGSPPPRIGVSGPARVRDGAPKLYALFDSYSVLPRRSGRNRAQRDALRDFANCNQAPQGNEQLASERDDDGRLASAGRTLGPCPIPLCERAIL